MWRCEDVKMWGCEDVKMRRCQDDKMWRCDVKMRRCEDEKMWRCEDVKMWGCEDVKMRRWEDVKMRRCEDQKMWRWADGRMLKMGRCEDEKMWRWEGVKMRRCEDEKMWRWEDVKMRRCEDEKMWRWADVKMRRCEVKTWRCENVWQTPTIRRTLRSDALGKNRHAESTAELLTNDTMEGGNMLPWYICWTRKTWVTWVPRCLLSYGFVSNVNALMLLLLATYRSILATGQSPLTSKAQLWATCDTCACDIFCFLLYCNYGFSLRILMRLSIDAFHFGLILGRLNPNFLLHHWGICQVVVGKDGRPQVFSSMNSVFEPHPTMLAMLLATFQFFLSHLRRQLKQFGITWAGLYVTWLWVQSYCFLFSWSSLSQEMFFLFAAFVAWLMTVSAFASIYTQQPGHALDVVLIPRAWNMSAIWLVILRSSATLLDLCEAAWIKSQTT